MIHFSREFIIFAKNKNLLRNILGQKWEKSKKPSRLSGYSKKVYIIKLDGFAKEIVRKSLRNPLQTWVRAMWIRYNTLIFIRTGDFRFSLIWASMLPILFLKKIHGEARCSLSCSVIITLCHSSWGWDFFRLFLSFDDF